MTNVLQLENFQKRLQNHKGLEGFVISTKQGALLHWYLVERPIALKYAALAQQLLTQSQTLLIDIDSQQSPQVLRLRTNKNELIISQDDNFIIVTIQNPSKAAQV
eukprot:TRINITY_DN2224_c2_g1_i1.p1 TRINITY_DN2224_c2_g1~~TRINITY_DN2224_c2_g1_i1.p1  ORF type:complete len:105 (-),score=49.68 TRINITY_DN2224_c2_g1_i1:166-480(-)